MRNQTDKQAWPGAAQTVLELALIMGAAIWIGRPYLDLRPDVWPFSGEFAMSIQNHYQWVMLLKCGGCFFWNGFSNGGVPAFIDSHSAWLHPLSMLATLLFGLFTGGKLLMVAGLALSGLALWWSAKVLGLGTLPRLWVALLAVSGGHIVGRMEATSVPLVLSTAACSLVIPPALGLALQGNRKKSLALGLMLGLAFLSGQGYLQIGMLVGLFAAIAWLLTSFQKNRLVIQPVWKEFALAILIGLLLAAPLWLPLLHHLPVTEKPTDPYFEAAQSFKDSFWNLVEGDPRYYFTEIRPSPLIPYVYINYIGWIPLLLAANSLITAPPKQRKLLHSLSIAAIAIYLISDLAVLKWMATLPFGGFAAGLRNAPLIQGFAVPLIILLAGFGLDFLIHKQWRFGPIQAPIPLGAKQLALGLLALASLASTFSFSQYWIRTYTPGVDLAGTIRQLKTEDAQWVQPPFGDYTWIPIAFENSIKFRFLYRPWRILGPDLPPPHLEAVNLSDNPAAPSYAIRMVPDAQYAYITDGHTQIPCQGKSAGGHIDVTCESDRAGTLFVIERALDGWKASRDGEPTPLLEADWLAVHAPAGRHEYSFRYRPWDAPLGIGLAASGLILSLVLYLRASKPVKQTGDGAAMAHD